MDTLAMRTIAGLGAVFGDAQGHDLNFDLLHDQRGTGGRLQAMAALGAQFQRIDYRTAIEEFRGKRLPEVAWVAGLAAAAPFAVGVGRWGLGRLYKIGRGGLGRGRRVLAGFSQLLLRLRELLLEAGIVAVQFLKLRLQCVQLRLQPLTIPTGGRRSTVHGKVILRRS